MPGESEQDDQTSRETIPPPLRQPGRGTGIAGGAYGLIGIGFEFLAAICLFGLIGWWVDGRLKTFPWLTILGGAVGFAAGLRLMVRAAGRAFKD